MIKSSLVIKILCLSIGLFIFGTSNATIWRVNKQSSATNVFTSIQSAIDNASVLNGDTLLIEGSTEAYGSFNLNKRLILIGNGYFLNENPNTSLEGATVIILGTASFNEGSDGSVLSGVYFGSGLTSYRPNVNTNDIMIQKCYFTYGIEIGDRILGLKLLQNYFGGTIDFHFALTTKAMQGTVFRNNIVLPSFDIATTLNNPRTFAAVENNLFLSDVSVTTSTYRNNIWLPLESSNIAVAAGIKEYNLNITVDMGAENNNQVFSSLGELYDGFGSTDGKWQLRSDSEFKGAGKDGTDPGPFGGPNPYVLSGVPAIPVIYEISTTGFGSTEEGLPVTIKVRAN